METDRLSTRYSLVHLDSLLEPLPSGLCPSSTFCLPMTAACIASPLTFSSHTCNQGSQLLSLACHSPILGTPVNTARASVSSQLRLLDHRRSSPSPIRPFPLTLSFRSSVAIYARYSEVSLSILLSEQGQLTNPHTQLHTSHCSSLIFSNTSARCPSHSSQ